MKLIVTLFVPSSRVRTGLYSHSLGSTSHRSAAYSGCLIQTLWLLLFINMTETSLDFEGMTKVLLTPTPIGRLFSQPNRLTSGRLWVPYQ